MKKIDPLYSPRKNAESKRMAAKSEQKMEPIQIGNRPIGREHPPFIIAEMSGNHNQSFARAIQLVEAAAEAGVDALKLQTYTADTMTLDISEREFMVEDPKSLWAGKSLYELYRLAHTPWEWHDAIFKRCRELGMIGFSTPFEHTAVDFLESLDVPCYKIASFENNDLPLIRKVAATGKPVIISTGLATVEELSETVQVAREAGCKDLILLKCASVYPAPPNLVNLRTLLDMRERFHVEVGLSDHTLGMGAGIASIAMGGTVIEKHFTLKREEGGVDSAFSMEPEEMKQFVHEAKSAWQSLGNASYGPSEEERPSLRFRRSLYAINDIQAGEVLTKENVKSIRPGLGLPPKFWDVILGKKAKRPIQKGTPIQREHVDFEQPKS